MNARLHEDEARGPTGHAGERATQQVLLAELLRPFAATLLPQLPARWVVYGAGEVGRALVLACAALGARPVAFVESEPAGFPDEVDGLAVWSPVRAREEKIDFFVLGTYASAEGMRRTLGEVFVTGERAWTVRQLQAPAMSLPPGEDLLERAHVVLAAGRSMAEFLWLEANKVERMDATVAVNAADRRQFHLDRYEFAATFASGRHVLDCACGTGYGSALLATRGPAASVIGIDLDEATVAYAVRHHSRGGVRFLVADAGRLDMLESGSVDLVVSFETIEHVPDDLAMLGELRRVLRPGGRLVVSTPNNWPVEISPFHVRTYDEAAFRAVLGGWFEVVAMYGQWPSSAGRPGRMALSSATDESSPECLVAVCDVP
ncbi:MAG: methyltransferase domain-containing protein [Vicinamibacteraceae bacterium]|nr:methyltransferase domain-containing protein [Vicinamibacteraceae bacterium]